MWYKAAQIMNILTCLLSLHIIYQNPSITHRYSFRPSATSKTCPTARRTSTYPVSTAGIDSTPSTSSTQLSEYLAEASILTIALTSALAAIVRMGVG